MGKLKDALKKVNKVSKYGIPVAEVVGKKVAKGLKDRLKDRGITGVKDFLKAEIRGAQMIGEDVGRVMDKVGNKLKTTSVAEVAKYAIPPIAAAKGIKAGIKFGGKVINKAKDKLRTTISNVVGENMKKTPMVPLKRGIETGEKAGQRMPIKGILPKGFPKKR